MSRVFIKCNQLKQIVMKSHYLVLLLPLVLFSCTIYYFDEPQPVDSQNIYKMPAKLIGSWYIKDSTDLTREDYDSISIGKTYYHLTTRERIVEEVSKVESDSNIFKIYNKIYYTENGVLNGGFDFSTLNDTMTIYTVENEIVELGKKAFLKKINYGYILNTNHDKMIDWWSLKFIDTRDNEKIIIRYINDDDVGKFPTHLVLSEDYKNYIKAKWSSNDIQSFIDKGGFSGTAFVLKHVDKLK